MLTSDERYALAICRKVSKKLWACSRRYGGRVIVTDFLQPHDPLQPRPTVSCTRR